jgi:hypothetical protein
MFPPLKAVVAVVEDIVVVVRVGNIATAGVVIEISCPYPVPTLFVA